jgi:hypothetical protein
MTTEPGPAPTTNLLLDRIASALERIALAAERAYPDPRDVAAAEEVARNKRLEEFKKLGQF